MTRTQRMITAIAGAVAFWFLFFGTVAYFVGLRGVGFGWPAFWSVGLLSLTPWVFLAGIVVAFRYVYPWITRGDTDD